MQSSVHNSPKLDDISIVTKSLTGTVTMSLFLTKHTGTKQANTKEHNKSEVYSAPWQIGTWKHLEIEIEKWPWGAS